jgi:hypothetical protein
MTTSTNITTSDDTQTPRSHRNDSNRSEAKRRCQTVLHKRKGILPTHQSIHRPARPTHQLMHRASGAHEQTSEQINPSTFEQQCNHLACRRIASLFRRFHFRSLLAYFFG